jgi:hypothetical protein
MAERRQASKSPYQPDQPEVRKRTHPLTSITSLLTGSVQQRSPSYAFRKVSPLGDITNHATPETKVRLAVESKRIFLILLIV